MKDNLLNNQRIKPAKTWRQISISGDGGRHHHQSLLVTGRRQPFPSLGQPAPQPHQRVDVLTRGVEVGRGLGPQIWRQQKWAETQ